MSKLIVNIRFGSRRLQISKGFKSIKIVKSEYFNEHRYSVCKNGTMQLKSGKKIKLRKWISELSRVLASENEKGYLQNRLNLIEKFEQKNIEGVQDYFNQEIVKTLNYGQKK